MNKPQLIIDAKAGNAEGPVWDIEKQLLYFVDIPGKKVHIYDPSTNTDRVIDVGQEAGCVVMKESGGLLAALRNGIYDLDVASGKLTFITDPESDLPENRFNDGKCDPAGRFWAGTMAADAKGWTGSLYIMGKDRQTRKALTGTGISNGLGWSPDNRTMYYIDTPTMRIDAFDYDMATGGIKNRRTIVHVPEELGHPDGMTVDAEGRLWVAMWGGWAVTRWDQATGSLLDRIELPAAKVSCCTFGGPELDELYITTASSKLSPEELANQPLAGGVFKMKTGVRGLPAFKFAG